MRERQVCFLFSDVADFAGLTERLGDRGACRTMARHHRIVRAACARAWGRELELRGDGFLLAFERSDEALACALDVQRGLERDRARRPDESVHVHMGLHRGPALRTGARYFGRSLVVAARLAELARPDEILISSSVEESLAASPARGDVRFGLVRRARLRGLNGIVRYRPVAWRPSALPVELADLNPVRLAGAAAAWLLRERSAYPIA